MPLWSYLVILTFAGLLVWPSIENDVTRRLRAWRRAQRHSRHEGEPLKR